MPSCHDGASDSLQAVVEEQVMAPDKRDVRVAARIAAAQRKAENDRIARDLDNGRSAMDIEIAR